MESINYHKENFFIDEETRIPNTDHIPGCKATKLIQRIKHPRVPSDICSFDYMGAAEFEGDLLNEVFEGFLVKKNLEAFFFEVEGPPQFPWSRKMRMYDDEGLSTIKKTFTLSTTIFVLAPREIRPHCELTIRHIAGGSENFLKRPTLLRDTMFSAQYWGDEKDDAIQGWVELDNGYMFFADEEMWRKFCKLYVDEQPDLDIKVTRPDFASIDKALLKLASKNK